MWSGAPTGALTWPVAGGLVVLLGLGILGAFRPDHRLALVRLGVLLALAASVGQLDAGVASSVVLVWFVAAAAVFPLVLPTRLAPVVPVAVAATFIGAAHLGPDQLAVGDAALRSGSFLAVGVASYVIGHVVLKVRGERDHAVGRLRKVEGAFQAAFNTSQSGMAIMDLKGNVKQVNQAMADFLGRSADSVARISWATLVHPDDLPAQAEQVQRLIKGEVWSFQAESRFRMRDKRVVWGLVGMSVVADASGRPEYLFAHVVSISDRVRSETKLRKSEAHFRSLFDLSPVPMWELDFSGAMSIAREWASEDLSIDDRLREAPESVEKALGTIKVRNVNEAARTLFAAADSADFASGFTAGKLGLQQTEVAGRQIVAISEGEARADHVVAMLDFDGDEHVGAQRMLVPRVDGNADTSSVMVAFVDATERRQTQHALQRIEERLRTVMGGAPIVLFAVDEHGVFTLFEGQGLSALGMSPGQAVGRSAFEMYRSSPTIIRNMRRALGGDAFTGTDEVDGLVFETRYSPTWDGGKVSGVIGVSYDTTERVRATERLRDLVRSKDEFVATVSHELRTPLTAVVGFAHELSSRMPGLAADEVIAYVNLIGDQAMEVGDLVEDLLVASRADHGEVPVRREAIDIWDEVDRVLDARRLGSEVHIEGRDEEAKVFADPVRVRQIVRNLMTNADRYGGPNITVQVGRTPDMWTLYVTDDGPGIDDRHQAVIFEPYHRAHRSEGRTESVGLGLTVSRQLARLMDGDLTYAYRDGRSVFALSLPAT